MPPNARECDAGGGGAESWRGRKRNKSSGESPFASTWDSFGASVEEHYKNKRRALEEAALEPYERCIKKMRMSAVERGHERVDAIRETLKQIDTILAMPRTQVQAIMQNEAIASCACTIYGQCFETNRLAIMKRNKWSRDDTTPWYIVTMPRRGGKTTANAQLALAYLLNLENVTLVVFAPSQGQANMFVQTVASYFNEGGFKSRFALVQRSGEKLVLHKSKADVRRIIARSSSIDIRCSRLSIVFSRAFQIKNSYSYDSPCRAFTN